MIHTRPNGFKYLYILFFSFIFLISTKSLAQSCEDLLLITKADSLFKIGNYPLAKEAYLSLTEKKYTKRVNYYYLAVCYGHLSLPDSACHYLSIAAQKGLRYQQLSAFKSDSNLDPIRKNANWIDVERAIIQNTLNQNSEIDSILLYELKIRREADQKYRVLFAGLTNQKQIDSLSRIQKKIDISNQKWLRREIRKNGWLTISKVGKEGEHITWLIVQHSDNNLAFQKKCLKKMMLLIDKNEIDRKNFAYLKDRVLINQGKKQLYGTQFSRTKEGTHFIIKSKPIQDAECVNSRRSYMNLPSLEYYLESASKRYNSD
jgi:hypothetical protein